MSDVDTAILALLDATVLNVHDGYVKDSDESSSTISAPTPYAIYFGAARFPINPRVGGTRDRGNTVAINCVGITREQADWAADKVEAALDQQRAQVGAQSRRIRLDERRVPRRDDTWSRPDGGPLFLVSLSFSV